MSQIEIPYGRQSTDESDVAAVAEVLRGDWLTTGPAVTEFEERLADFTGAPTVAVTSGTAALHCAYATAGVGPGHEIVTSPLTFVATAATALQLGATVVFADVRDDTLNLDPEAARAACGPRTQALVPIDYAGHPADMDAMRRIADDVGAVLIEDAAHSLGATRHGRPVGTMADLTTLSFHPVKLITTGEGGAVAVARKELLEPVRRFRNHGLVRDPAAMRNPDEGGWHQEVHELGLNYRLPDVLAALGTSQLAKLPDFLDRRRHLVARYRKLLDGLDDIRLPVELDGVESAWHLFPIRIRGGRRRAVYDWMRAAGIGVQVHWLPAHLHPALIDLGNRRGSCPVAEAAYEELLSLPLFPGLTDEQQDRVVTELDAALAV